MKKRLGIVLLSLMLFLGLTPAGLAANEPAVYTALMRYNASFYKDEAATQKIGTIAAGKRVNILKLEPAQLKIEFNGKVGYINRKFLDDYTAVPLNPTATPAYPGIQNTYLGWISETTDVKAAPNEKSESLITLGQGTRLSFVGMENGWAKLIFKRQWGYVDTRKIDQLLPYDEGGDMKATAPLAGYTSFYNIATNPDNLNRIQNLRVTCDKFASLSIPSGGNFDFNRDLGPYRESNGYFPAIVLIDGGSKLGYGGGTCQSSSTLYNTVLQLPGLQVDHRRPHGPAGASYLPHGADAAVGNTTQNFIFTNNYPFPIRIEGTVQDGAITVAIWRAN